MARTRDQIRAIKAKKGGKILDRKIEINKNAIKQLKEADDIGLIISFGITKKDRPFVIRKAEARQRELEKQRIDL